MLRTLRQYFDGFLLVSALFSIAAPALADPMWLGEKYDVRASSELKSERNRYAAKNLIPPSLGTAWCEGVKGDGINEWVELTLKEPITGNDGFSLEILPGYVMSYATYKKNGRPKILAVTINDDPRTKQITLQDYGRTQSFFFATNDWPWPVKKIGVTILDVYKGEQYADTCITDIAIMRPYPSQDDPRYRNMGALMQEERAMMNQDNVDPERMTRDALSFIMGLSQGLYYSGAEGGEGLDGEYLESLMHNPGLFLWVLDKQSDAVLNATSKAIISPIDDRYSESQIRDGLIKGLHNLDIGSRERLKPLLDAYSIKELNP